MLRPIRHWPIHCQGAIHGESSTLPPREQTDPPPDPARGATYYDRRLGTDQGSATQRLGADEGGLRHRRTSREERPTIEVSHEYVTACRLTPWRIRTGNVD